MDSDKHRPVSVLDPPPRVAGVDCDPAAGGGDDGDAPMKDDRVAADARISPTRDPKLWRSRKLIVARPARVDHRSTPEVAAPRFRSGDMSTTAAWSWSLARSLASLINAATPSARVCRTLRHLAE